MSGDLKCLENNQLLSMPLRSTKINAKLIKIKRSKGNLLILLFRDKEKIDPIGFTIKKLIAS